MRMDKPAPDKETGSEWDHSSRSEFLAYYANKSLDQETRDRFLGVLELAQRLLGPERGGAALDMLDVGCGPGTQALLWAGQGHRVHGLDVNQDFLDLGRQRASAEGLDIDFRLGSATELPWDDASMDVVLLPELLEHVADWQGCLNEAIRVLKPGGLLYFSTTNTLCPKQEEFTLPLYSWYPAALKRHYEKLAVTTRPEIANYAKYPAVNWFTPYGLGRYLRRRGLSRTYDRLDCMDLAGRSAPVALVIRLLRALPPLRFAFHCLTPYTLMVGIKD
jgi:2-polyprenyl-3-methyl-5-hydroxy-6-metoxy-1,4-benzoquinol methylase